MCTSLVRFQSSVERQRGMLLCSALSPDREPEPRALQLDVRDVYREKVRSLCHALEHEASRAGATDAIHGLIEAVLLEPDGDPKIAT